MHSATSDGSFIRQAPKRPACTRSDVQVDLVITPVGTDARGGGERLRLAATQLQRHRMLAGVEAQQPLAVAVQHRLRVHHLGVEQCAGRQDAVERAAVPVGPVHHRSNGECAH